MKDEKELKILRYIEEKQKALLNMSKKDKELVGSCEKEIERLERKIGNNFYFEYLVKREGEVHCDDIVKMNQQKSIEACEEIYELNRVISRTTEKYLEEVKLLYGWSNE